MLFRGTMFLFAISPRSVFSIYLFFYFTPKNNTNICLEIYKVPVKLSRYRTIERWNKKYVISLYSKVCSQSQLFTFDLLVL